MRHRLGMFCLIVFSLITTGVLAQEDFSANVVTQKDGKQTTSPTRIYITKDKMRFESSQPNGHSGAMIVNFSTQTSDVLMPERKMYMEFPTGQGPGARQMQGLFRVRDVEDACGDWQKMAAKPGGTCRKVGSEAVNGRSTVKYQGTSASGEVSNIWLDPKLRFPVRWETKDSGGELQDIKEGSQPASLFAIPGDYQKMQMPAGMPGMPGMPPQH